MSTMRDELVKKHPYMPDIVNRIKELLDEKKLSQRKFADEIGVHPGHVSKVFSMVSLPSATILIKMAIAGYDMNYILKGEKTDSESRVKELEEQLKLADFYASKLEQQLFKK
ncbi:Predicted transcriptional regulators (HipB) [uncultured Mediterranean phage uvMED]|nr:Predicted transcriptional regulators (HipB) [uncultured Mediterranean phage uvMED]